MSAAVASSASLFASNNCGKLVLELEVDDFETTSSTATSSMGNLTSTAKSSMGNMTSTACGHDVKKMKHAAGVGVGFGICHFVFFLQYKSIEITKIN